VKPSRTDDLLVMLAMLGPLLLVALGKWQVAQES